MTVEVQIKLLHEKAQAPKRMSAEAAAYDLFFPGPRTNIWQGNPTSLPLGFAMAIPRGYEAQIRPRSGLAKAGLWCHFGTIDSDYRGEVSVLMYTIRPCSIDPGDRIAQMVIHKLPDTSIEIVDELTETERGTGGFGSTGA